MWDGLQESFFAVTDDLESEGNLAAEVAILVTFGFYAIELTFLDAGAFELGDAGEDTEEHFGGTVLGDGIGADIDDDECDVIAFEEIDHVEGIGGGAEDAVEFGGDEGIARL